MTTRGNFFAVDLRAWAMVCGLEFIPENGGGAGIRFRERKT